MRKLSLFLAVIMCFGLFTAFPASAATISVTQEVISPEDANLTVNVNAVEGLSNFSFEAPMDSSNWVKLGHAQDTVERSSVSKNGSYSLKIENGETTVSPKTAAHNGCSIKPGVTYELSAWVKTENVTEGSAYLHGIFTGYDENGQSLTYSRLNLYFTSATEKNFDWTKKIMRFTAPQGATSLTIYAYSTVPYGGTVYFDDVSLLVPKESVPELDSAEPKAPVGGNYLIRETFEGWTTGSYVPASQSSAFNRFGGHHAVVSEEQPNADTGSTKSLKMRLGSNAAQAGFTTCANLYKSVSHGLVPGATYQVSVNVLAPEFGTEASIAFWIDLEDNEGNKDQKKRHIGFSHYPWWRTIVFEFVMPENIASASFSFRYFSASYDAYFDDFSVYIVEEPAHAFLDTDELFYYSEWETGVATATPNDYFGDELLGGKVIYSFLDKDKETVLDTEEVLYVNGKADYTFPTSLMADLGKEYFINAKNYKADGTMVQDETVSVYRFNRPTYLGADGVFRKGGKEINIVLGNGVNTERLNKNPQNGGVTVVQIVADPASMGTSLRDRMDLAYEKGLFCLINFYSGYTCGGSEGQIESTLRTVEWAKDHPALFGYKIQDEPYQKGNTDEEMTRAYVGIRNIDPDHPIYLDDSVEGGYDWLYRYADIIDIDYYGGSNTDSGKIFTDKMEKARAATKNGRKPFTLLQQAFPYLGYQPTVDELRNFAYQAFFAGASGFGYHSLGVDGSDGQDVAYIDSANWAEICERWAPFEQGFLFDAFVNDKYEEIDSYRGDHVMWKTFKDGKDVYVVIFNREKQSSSTASISVDIDAENFQAQRLAGAVADTTTSARGTDTLSLTLSPLAAEIWKISPMTSLIENSEFEAAFNGAPGDTWASVLHNSSVGTLGSASAVSSAAIGETTVMPATEDSAKFLQLQRHNGEGGDLSKLNNRATFLYTKLDSSILETGKSYRLEYYVNIPEGTLGDGVKARVNFQNGAAGHLGVWRDHNLFAPDSTNMSMTATDGWEKKTIDFVYDGSEIQLNIGLYGAGAAGTVFVDEMKLYPYIPETFVIQKQDFETLTTEAVNTVSQGYLTRDTRGSLSVVSDPQGGTNKVLKAHPTAIQLPLTSALKMSSADATLAVKSYTEKETLKVSFRLYVPTGTYTSGETTMATNVDGFKFGIYYKDVTASSASTSGLAQPLITFAGSDANRWINMEAYLKANCTTQPKIWFLQGSMYDYYIDDVVVELINSEGYISDMQITHYGSSACLTTADTDQNWGYVVAGTYGGAYKTTDTIRPLISYSCADTAKKAVAIAVLSEIKDGAEVVIDMKMQNLGRIGITSLTGAYAAETGIASEELSMNLSEMKLPEGTYRVSYMLWDYEGLSPLTESVTRTVTYAAPQN